MRHGTTETAKIPAIPVGYRSIRKSSSSESSLGEIAVRSMTWFAKAPQDAADGHGGRSAKISSPDHADRRDEQRQPTGRPQRLPSVSRDCDRSRPPWRCSSRGFATTRRERRRVRFSLVDPAAVPATEQVRRRADPLAVPQRHFDGRFLRGLASADGRRRPESQSQRGRAAQGAMVAGIRRRGADATSPGSSTCMSGRTASTSMFAWKTRPISGNACSFSWERRPEARRN